MEDGYQTQFKYAYFTYVHDIMIMQHLYTFSSVNVPYSVEEEKSLCKTAHLPMKYSLREQLSITTHPSECVPSYE